MIEIDNEPWFVAADVCRVLGFPLVSSGGHPIAITQYLHRLDSCEKKIVKKNSSEGQTFKALFPPAGGYMTTIISESGLYKLIMRSDKPEARAFQDWVTKVVLPAILVSSEGTPCEPCLSTPRHHGSKLLIFHEPPSTM